MFYRKGKAGEEYGEHIIWYEKGSYRQTSTLISDIEGIAVKQKRNKKWKGLAIGSIMDGIAVSFIVLLFYGYIHF